MEPSRAARWVAALHDSPRPDETKVLYWPVPQFTNGEWQEILDTAASKGWIWVASSVYRCHFISRETLGDPIDDGMILLPGSLMPAAAFRINIAGPAAHQRREVGYSLRHYPDTDEELAAVLREIADSIVSPEAPGGDPDLL